jgi:hypothetical protein
LEDGGGSRAAWRHGLRPRAVLLREGALLHATSEGVPGHGATLVKDAVAEPLTSKNSTAV